MTKMSRELVGFPEMTPVRKMFFDSSMLDIQWENKVYTICQILQYNDQSFIEKLT